MTLDHRSIFGVCIALLAVAALTLGRTSLPQGQRTEGRHLRRLSRDLAQLLGNRQVRGALIVSAAAIVIGAMVLVNTVVLVRSVFDLDDRATAIALAAYGAGGIAGASFLPPVMRLVAERAAMIFSGTAMAGLLMRRPGLAP